MIEENCLIASYNQLLGLLSISEKELTMGSNKELFTIDDEVAAGVASK